MKFTNYLKGIIFNRSLIIELTYRELYDRYRNLTLGAFWLFVNQFWLLIVYVFVFATVFKVKISLSYEMPKDYTAYILSGLIPWMGLLDCYTRSSNTFKSHLNLLKQVIFPAYVLPIKNSLAAFILMTISLLFLTIYLIISRNFDTFIIPMLLLGLINGLLFMVGVSNLFSVLGGLWADFKDLVQMYCVAGIYLMPVVYLPDWIPSLFKPLIFLNPSSYFIWIFQDIFYFTRFDHLYAWIITFILSLMMILLSPSLIVRSIPIISKSI